MKRSKPDFQSINRSALASVVPVLSTGRATPSLRRAPNAHQTSEQLNPAGFHLTAPRICSNKPGQF